MIALMMNSLYGKFGESSPLLEGEKRLYKKATFYQKRGGKPAQVTPEGHVFHKAYRSGVYRCLFCGCYRQTRRGRPEFKPGTPLRNGCPALDDAQWSTEALKCPIPDQWRE